MFTFVIMGSKCVYTPRFNVNNTRLWCQQVYTPRKHWALDRQQMSKIVSFRHGGSIPLGMTGKQLVNHLKEESFLSGLLIGASAVLVFNFIRKKLQEQPRVSLG
mgnify:CR=1 FL=1